MHTRADVPIRSLHGMLIVIAGLCWLVAAAPAPAQEAGRSISIAKLPAASPIARQWLVLIAIDDYANENFLNDLESCRADALALRNLLFNRFGYTPEHTIELFDVQATRRDIERTLYNLIENRVGPEDSVLLAFSGHGYYDENTGLGYWYPHDAEAKADGISNSLIRDWCASFKARKVLVVADSCFAGALLVRSGYTPDATRKSRELLAAGGMHPVADSGSPDRKHSIFNHYLRASLQRLADKGQAFVTNDLYVDLFVPVKTNSDQEPQMGILQNTYHEGGRFLFYPRGAAPAPPVPPVKTDAEVRPPLEIPSFDTQDMEKAAEARRKAEESRRQFCERAQTALAALVQKDADEFITAREKAAKYKEFLDTFRGKDEECDARLSTEFAQAEERMTHWRTWKPAPTPRPTQAATPAPPPATGRTENEYQQDGRRYRKVDLGGGVTMNLVYIRGGTFTMGSPDNESGRDSDEGPQTRVTLTDDFWMGETEVTQAQWKAVMGSDPPDLYFPGNPHNPVERVSWNDVMGEQSSGRPTPQPGSFMARLSERTKMQFTLPTEAQWEYACRADPSKTTRYSFGDSDSSLGNYAWYDKNSGDKTQPVKTKNPNAWGLYDMHGNVWEWCLDWYADKLPGGSVTNPTGPSSGSGRVFRGGSWDYAPRRCRSAARSSYSPEDRRNYLGFRAVAAVQ